MSEDIERDGKPVEHRARRELNNGFGDAMAKAVELTLTPVIMGGIGLLLDRWLGTWPVFALIFFLFTIGYVVWKMFVRYDAEMRRHEANIPGRKPGAVS